MNFERSTSMQERTPQRREHSSQQTGEQRVADHSTKWIQELSNSIDAEIGEATIAARLLERSKAFGINAWEYKQQVQAELHEREGRLAYYARELSTMPGNHIKNHQDGDRLQHLLTRIEKAQDMIAINLGKLKQAERNNRELPQDAERGTYAGQPFAPSPWAAYRQDLVTQRNHLPEPPQNPYNASPAPQRDSNTQSPWANWKPEQQSPSTPTQQSPSFFKKSATAVSRWLKSWF